MPTNTELIQRAVNQNSELDKQIALLEIQTESLQKEINRIDTISISERVAVIEDRVSELKRLKEESRKRHWQFVYIAMGAVFTVNVQLVIAWVKK